MVRRMSRLVVLTIVLAAGAVSLPACGASLKTNVSPVADVANAAGKVAESAHVVLVEAQKGRAIVLPNGQPLVSRRTLDGIAIAVDRIGHLGLDLDNALGDYNAAKAAGQDVTAQRAVVSKVLGDIGGALADVGTAIPPGTLATIDQAVATIFNVLTLVKGGVGL